MRWSGHAPSRVHRGLRRGQGICRPPRRLPHEDAHVRGRSEQRDLPGHRGLRNRAPPGPPRASGGGLALGIPRWKVILRVVVPTAGPGIFTAIMLAVARGLGETAPVLLTSLGNDFMNTSPFQPTDTVSLRVYNYAQ